MRRLPVRSVVATRWERPARQRRQGSGNRGPGRLPPSEMTRAANHHEVTLVRVSFDVHTIEAKPERWWGVKAHDSDAQDKSLKDRGVERTVPDPSNWNRSRRRSAGHSVAISDHDGSSATLHACKSGHSSRADGSQPPSIAHRSRLPVGHSPRVEFAARLLDQWSLNGVDYGDGPADGDPLRAVPALSDVRWFGPRAVGPSIPWCPQ